MQQASAKFLAAVRASHQVLSYIDIIGPNAQPARLFATGGDVQIDRTAATRRRCTATCVDPGGLSGPGSVSALLVAGVTELRPYRGIVYSDKTTEVMPLGVFRLSKVTLTDQVGGAPSYSLECYDSSWVVSRDKFISPYTVAAGTNVIDAIKAILTRTFDNLTYDAISTTVKTTAPLVYDVADDPWDAASDLATSAGCELFFSATGRVVIAPPTDIDSLPAPAFTYIEGQQCSMIDLSNVRTVESGYNGVVLTGESPADETAPVRSVVWDEEPSSATYHLGEYGEVPMFVTDQNVKTQDEADAAAAALLAGQLGFSSQLSLTAWPNSALDAGDVVQVVRQRSNINDLYAIDGLTIPLATTATQPITLRQKRNT
jgi:hypothetical protein